MAAIHGWAAGDELADMLDDEEMTGGDFVRNVKQVIDLLRQIADVAPDPETAATARAGADALPARSRRGLEHRHGARSRDDPARGGVGEPGRVAAGPRDHRR